MGSIALAMDVSPKPMLGSILGGLNTMQPIGVLFFLQLGGFLYDKVGPWTPWALKGGANLLLFVWLLMVRSRIQKEVEEAEAYAAEHSHHKVTTEVMTDYRKELGM